jgi:hypothetical protein
MAQLVFWLLDFCFAFYWLSCRQLSCIVFIIFPGCKSFKGTFRVGRFASVPRKVLVVLQFSVSVILIIGTIVVYRQIHAKTGR